VNVELDFPGRLWLMTDESVKRVEKGANREVGQGRKHRDGGALLHQLAPHVGKPSQALRVVERHLKADASSEEVLEELVGCFLHARQAFNDPSSDFSFTLSQLARLLGRAARSRGIDADRFYSCMVERALEGPGDEGGRSAPKASTREKILRAAFDLFCHKGFRSTTVDEVAETAGVGKGSFYRYFSNKEAVFNELIRLRLEELEERARSILDGEDDVLTMITKYLRVYFQFFDENQCLYRLIVQEQLDLGDQVQDLHVRRVMRRTPVLKRKIREAAQQGLLKDADFQTVFYGVMGFIHGVIQKWLAQDCAYSLVEEVPVVREVLFYGFVQDRC